MFKTPYYSIVLLALITLVGCIIPGARRERAELELQKNDSLFVVDEGDFHFRIVLPKDLMINHEPRIHYVDNENKLIITCGPFFNLFATVAEINTPLLTSSDSVFQHIVMDNEDQSLVFKRTLPDGQVYDFGMIQHTEINGTHYRFQTDANGEFSLEDVLKMKSALASLKI
jgi:hypothetical protein